MRLSNCFLSLAVLLSGTSFAAPATPSEQDVPLKTWYRVSIDKSSGRRLLEYVHFSHRKTYYGDAAPVIAALPKECTMDPVAKLERFYCPLTTSFNGKESFTLMCNSKECTPSGSTVIVPFHLLPNTENKTVQVDLGVDRFNTFRGDYSMIVPLFGPSCRLDSSIQVPTVSCDAPISLPYKKDTVNVFCEVYDAKNVVLKCGMRYI